MCRSEWSHVVVSTTDTSIESQNLGKWSTSSSCFLGAVVVFWFGSASLYNRWYLWEDRAISIFHKTKPVEESDDKKRIKDNRLTSSSSGLPEKHQVFENPSSPMIISTRMSGKGLNPISTWSKMWRTLRSQLLEREICKNCVYKQRAIIWGQQTSLASTGMTTSKKDSTKILVPKI